MKNSRERIDDGNPAKITPMTQRRGVLFKSVVNPPSTMTAISPYKPQCDASDLQPGVRLILDSNNNCVVYAELQL